jgi:hypothetical protein
MEEWSAQFCVRPDLAMFNDVAKTVSSESGANGVIAQNHVMEVCNGEYVKFSKIGYKAPTSALKIALP